MLWSRGPLKTLSTPRAATRVIIRASHQREVPGEYRLTRFVIFCCAADAEALQVVVRGDRAQRQRDQWLEVQGRWVSRPVPATDDPDPPSPVLTADAVRPIAPPHTGPMSTASSTPADHTSAGATQPARSPGAGEVAELWVFPK